MIIQSNASENEKSSPFYKSNEEFCMEFEKFIAEKNGSVKGKYNSWSYTVYGKINKPKNWILKYKKGTYSGGNLLLNSKYQNLLTLAEWSTESSNKNSEFLIRKRKIFDFIRFYFLKSFQRVSISDRYTLISKETDSKLFLELIQRLSPLFKSEEIYRIENNEYKLKIELRTDKHNFDYFNKISEL